MRLRDAILLSLSAGFLIIGIHQTMTFGFAKAYWALMLTIVLFFAYGLGKKPKDQQGKSSAPSQKHSLDQGKKQYPGKSRKK